MQQIHSLLKRQLKKHFKKPDRIPGEWDIFLEMVNDAYNQFDDDRNMLERSLELSSQELIQANSEMRAMFQAFPDILFRLDNEGTILDFKTGTRRDLYLLPKQVIGKRIQDVPVKNVSQMFQDAIRKVAQEGKAIVSIEYELSFPKGRRFYEARMVPLRGNQIIAIIRDITPSKEAEKAQREIEERHRVVLETSPDPIVAYDTQWRVTYLNPAFTRVFGWTLEELSGKELGYIPEEVQNNNVEMKQKIKRGESFSDFETKRYNKQGMLIDVSISVAIWRDSEGKPLGSVITLRDITEQKKLESHIFQMQKMDAIGILAGGVAHDFNNLLTAIRGNTDMAIIKIDEADPSYGNLKEIRNATVRAADLTKQLLLFSRKQPTRLSLFNLNNTIDGMLKMIRRLIGEDIIISADLDPSLWPIRADSGNIEQLILNMAVNARDAMPHGGKISFKTQNLEIDDDCIRNFPEALPGRYVSMAIADTGAGMDRETLEHLFEPFFSTKGIGKGTGLGLSVVYGIVKNHGGWVDVMSESGHGSTFKIYLPASSGIPEDDIEEKISIEDFKGNGQRILVVEDEENIREFVVGALSKNGYRVFEAANFKDAMEVFEREEGEFQIIFTDVVLPDENGLQLVDKLLPLNPGLKFLLTSGYTDEKSQWPLIRQMKFRFLPKPYSLSDLLIAVKETIGHN